jgi:hypothetical protein
MPFFRISTAAAPIDVPKKGTSNPLIASPTGPPSFSSAFCFYRMPCERRSVKTASKR